MLFFTISCPILCSRRLTPTLYFLNAHSWIFELPCKTSYSSARETAWGRPENHENSLAEPGRTAILPKPVDEWLRGSETLVTGQHAAESCSVSPVDKWSQSSSHLSLSQIPHLYLVRIIFFSSLYLWVIFLYGHR